MHQPPLAMPVGFITQTPSGPPLCITLPSLAPVRSLGSLCERSLRFIAEVFGYQSLGVNGPFTRPSVLRFVTPIPPLAAGSSDRGASRCNIPEWDPCNARTENRDRSNACFIPLYCLQLSANFGDHLKGVAAQKDI